MKMQIVFRGLKEIVKKIGDKEVTIDQKTKNILLTWGLAMVIFLAISVVCIRFIFAPVEQVFDNGHGDRTITAKGATDLIGLKLMGESWKAYPDYVIGLGTAAIISFGGAVFCIYNITKAKEVE
jgi:hypothetical protein